MGPGRPLDRPDGGYRTAGAVKLALLGASCCLQEATGGGDRKKPWAFVHTTVLHERAKNRDRPVPAKSPTHVYFLQDLENFAHTYMRLRHTSAGSLYVRRQVCGSG